MSPPARVSRAKFRWGIAFATGLKLFIDPVTKLRMKHTNRKCRIPRGLHPHRIEDKLIKRNVGGEWIIEREMMMISKDGTISKFPEYHSSEEEEPIEQPRSLNKYGFVEHTQLQDDDELEKNEADADDEEEEEPMEEEEVKEDSEKKRSKEASKTGSNSESLEMAPSRRSGPSNEENPDIDTIIAQQLQNILPQIITQVTNNVNNANGGNGGNNGCSYKGFMACNPKEYDGKGGAIALTRWIKKMENVIDNSGCSENQKVKYAASSFVNKALTWWNIQVQARGREATIGMSWTDFKALLVEELCPSNEMEKLETEFWNHKMVGANHAGYTDRFHELAKLVPHLVTPESSRIKRYIASLAPEIRGMLRATQPTTIQSAILRDGILTDEAVSCGTLTKGNEKRKGVEETSKQGGWGNDNKRVKVSKGFMVATPHRNEYVVSHPKCAKCWTHHPEGGPCQVCFNCQKLGHFARNCRMPVNFISTNFTPLLNENPSFVNPGYVIEVVDGNKVEINRIIHDCKLELRNSLFTIDLIPLGHGSFDVIVGMDWLSKHKAGIVCHEKVVRIPLESCEILHVQGEHTSGIAKALRNVKVDKPKLRDISVVQDFVEVSFINARIVWAASRVARQGFYMTTSFSVGSTAEETDNSTWSGRGFYCIITSHNLAQAVNQKDISTAWLKSETVSDADGSVQEQGKSNTLSYLVELMEGDPKMEGSHGYPLAYLGIKGTELLDKLI
ncbi:putative reverse transcriptase domain-containing protein [Tanacetum coccineum]